MEKFLITDVKPAYFPNYLKCKVINIDTNEIDCIFVNSNPHLVIYTFAQFGAKENKFLYHTAYLYGCTSKENKTCVHNNLTKSYNIYSIDNSKIYIDLIEIVEPVREEVNRKVVEEILCSCDSHYLSNSRIPRYLWSEFKDKISGKHIEVMFNANVDICTLLARLRLNDEIFPDSYFMGALNLENPELRISNFGQSFRCFQLIKSLKSFDFYFEIEENKLVKLSYIENESNSEFSNNEILDDDLPF